MSQINAHRPETVGGGAEIVKAISPLFAPVGDLIGDLFGSKPAPKPAPIPWIPIIAIGGGVTLLITTVLIVKAKR